MQVISSILQAQQQIKPGEQSCLNIFVQFPFNNPVTDMMSANSGTASRTDDTSAGTPDIRTGERQAGQSTQKKTQEEMRLEMKQVRCGSGRSPQELTQE